MFLITKDREKLLSQMTEETHKLAVYFEGRFARTAGVSVVDRYDLGESLRTATEEESTYGADAEHQLAMYLAIDGGVAMCRALRMFAATFKREFIVKEAPIPRSDGKEVQLHHWLSLSRVASEKERNRLLKQVRTENLSVQALQTLIRSGEAGVKNVRTGNNGPKPPKSPSQGLAHLTKLGKSLLNFMELLPDAVFDKIDDAPAENLDAKLFEALVGARDMLALLEDRANCVCLQLSNGPLSRVSRVLKLGIPIYEPRKKRR